MNEKLEKLNQEIIKTETKLYSDKKPKQQERQKCLRNGKLWHAPRMRAQLYTTYGGALRSAEGMCATSTVSARPMATGHRSSCGKRMILVRSNHHRGRYASPALAAASYPFVDLPPGITLHYNLFLSDKLSKIRLCFFYEIVYNEASDKSVFVKETSYD